MFTLVADKSKYFRVKDGQSREEIEAELRIPAGEIYAGKIIERGEPMQIYFVKPLENYGVIARKLDVSEEELKALNAHKPVYPTCKLFVPYKKRRVSI
ncbi:MAG: hypothetical protein HFE41_01375 [Clostridia bacterium]|jgi:hypothetical protein|nr:hypothetical protein [Clostridia bacterium]